VKSSFLKAIGSTFILELIARSQICESPKSFLGLKSTPENVLNIENVSNSHCFAGEIVETFLFVQKALMKRDELFHIQIGTERNCWKVDLESNRRCLSI
jgi:hypothetical protein